MYPWMYVCVCVCLYLLDGGTKEYYCKESQVLLPIPFISLLVNPNTTTFSSFFSPCRLHIIYYWQRITKSEKDVIL